MRGTTEHSMYGSVFQMSMNPVFYVLTGEIYFEENNTYN